jgi:hypothetical protein
MPDEGANQTAQLHLETAMLALSVRQPYAELILSGVKQQENRSRVTHVRGRVYIYAAKKLASALTVLDIPRNKELPLGYLLGTVEIYDCTTTTSGYAWLLRDPLRLRQPILPKNRPNPVWFYPFEIES